MDLSYLNVDLEVRSAESLAPLVAGLGDEVIVLRDDEHAGRFHASFELSQCDLGAEETILGFCDLIEGLPAGVREHWERCERREFNLGYELAPGGPSAEVRLSELALRRMAALGAALGFTVYDPAQIPPMPAE